MTLDPKHAWQTSADPDSAPMLADVRATADKFYRKVRLRNLVEYVSCVIVAAAFSRNILVLPHILQKIGSGCCVAATFYVAWHLHRRGSAIVPKETVEMPLYVFARTQLVRQRDLLRNIFWWYILPFIPGLTLVLIGNGQDPLLSRHVPIWQRWVALGSLVLTFGGIWWINQVAARKLQRRIDEIDALTGED